MKTDIKAVKKRSMEKVDLYFLIVVLLFLLMIFILSFTLSKTAGIVPRLISGLGLMLTIIKVDIQLKEIKESKKIDTDDKPDEGFASNGRIPWYISIAIAIAYLSGMVVLGFVISTFIALLLVPPLLGYKKRTINIISAVIITSILYSAFVNLFYVRLPIGLLFKNLI